MKARLEEAILGTIGARQEMVRRHRGGKHNRNIGLRRACLKQFIFVVLKEIYSYRKEPLWQPGER